MTSELKTLGAYIKAVAKYWWAIVTGLILTIVDGIERLLGTWYLFPLWAKTTTGIVGFTVAQYLAYKDLANSVPETQRMSSRSV